MSNKKNKQRHDEPEKPFWISYADLMSALAILFLITSTVTIVSMASLAEELEKQKKALEAKNVTLETIETIRSGEINKFNIELKEQLKLIGADYDEVTNSIILDQRANFKSGSHELTPEGAELLKNASTKVLETIRKNPYGKWVKAIIVEGHTDTDGDYLMNLDLSQRRAQKALCLILTHDSDKKKDAELISMAIDYFAVGGNAFKYAKSSKEESRRAELKVEYLHNAEKRTKLQNVPSVGTCRI